MREALDGYAPIASDQDYWSKPAPQSMLIDEVELIWAAIDKDDDWAPLYAKLDALAEMSEAMGAPPVPAGHVD